MTDLPTTRPPNVFDAKRRRQGVVIHARALFGGDWLPASLVQILEPHPQRFAEWERITSEAGRAADTAMAEWKTRRNEAMATPGATMIPASEAPHVVVPSFRSEVEAEWAKVSDTCRDHLAEVESIANAEIVALLAPLHDVPAAELQRAVDQVRADVEPWVEAVGWWRRHAMANRLPDGSIDDPTRLVKRPARWKRMQGFPAALDVLGYGDRPLPRLLGFLPTGDQ